MTPGGIIGRFKTGLWHENPGLVQLLGLCPLLAVTSTFVNGFGVFLRLSRNGTLKLKGKGDGAAQVPRATRQMRAKLKLKGQRAGR